MDCSLQHALGFSSEVAMQLLQMLHREQPLVHGITRNLLHD